VVVVNQKGMLGEKPKEANQLRKSGNVTTTSESPQLTSTIKIDHLDRIIASNNNSLSNVPFPNENLTSSSEDGISYT